MRIPTLAPWLATAALLAIAPAAGAEEPPPASPVGSAAASAPPSGSVERSVVTSLVFEREPQDALEQVASDAGKVFYFTELRDMPGATVIHRWEHAGEVVAEIPTEVGSARWRTYSTKDLAPDRLGAWTVSTVDSSGRVLDTRQFTVVQAPRATAPPAAPTP
jgi:hypothetical protein